MNKTYRDRVKGRMEYDTIQKFHIPIHYLVPVGAVMAVIWQTMIQYS
jgi:hypothetical protein